MLIRRMLACLSSVLIIASLPAVRAASDAPVSRQQVAVPTLKTSIYLGTVSLELPPFSRAEGAYHSTYRARVFPYFFFNESGRLSIEVPDDALRQLERGEPIDFRGSAVSRDGGTRAITGRATPETSGCGRLKIRVAVPGGIQLVFNSTYQFVGP